MEHFCVKLVENEKGFKLARDNFAIINTKPSLRYSKFLADKNAYEDGEGKKYREEWCNEYRELCLKNYDLTMQYFSLLDSENFNNALNRFLRQYTGFKEVFDLNDYSGVEGYYIMVLDDYKQVYIGKSNDIKRRILQHWSKTKSFDRTLSPLYAYNESCFSIDFFRALDTTRIFVCKFKITDGIEKELIRYFPIKYRTNRIGGDVTNLFQAIATMTKRKL